MNPNTNTNQIYKEVKVFDFLEFLYFMYDTPTDPQNSAKCYFDNYNAFGEKLNGVEIWAVLRTSFTSAPLLLTIIL